MPNILSNDDCLDIEVGEYNFKNLYLKNCKDKALQTKMKVLGIDNSYEKIKKITRTNAKINELKLEITKFINDLDISIEEKEKLLNLTPSNYTGIFI